MKYFRIDNATEVKIIGKYPQVKEGINYVDVESEKFISNFFLKEIDIIPIIPDLVLWKNTKLTDLLSVFATGMNHGLLVSNKLKEIFEKYSKGHFQPFKVNVFKNDVLIDGYFYLHYKFTSNHLIDFPNSQVFVYEYFFNKISPISINSLEEFTKINKEQVYPKSLGIEKIKIKDSVSDEIFMFLFFQEGIGPYVSEKIKQEIEEAGCTGIQFVELH